VVLGGVDLHVGPKHGACANRHAGGVQYGATHIHIDQITQM
jgi:hypothetical protein